MGKLKHLGAVSKNYSKIPNNLFGLELSTTATAVFVYLLAQREGFSITHASIAAGTGWGKCSVRNGVRELTEKGLLETSTATKSGMRGVSQYTLRIDRVQETGTRECRKPELLVTETGTRECRKPELLVTETGTVNKTRLFNKTIYTGGDKNISKEDQSESTQNDGQSQSKSGIAMERQERALATLREHGWADYQSDRRGRIEDAEAALRQCMNEGIDPAPILRGLKAFIAERAAIVAQDAAQRQYTPSLARFFREQRWRDYQPRAENASTREIPADFYAEVAQMRADLGLPA